MRVWEHFQNAGFFGKRTYTSKYLKPSKTGNQAKMKLKHIFMSKSPIIFTMFRLSRVEWACLLDQREQHLECTAAEDPGLGYFKMENKGVLEEAMMLKDENRNLLSCCGVLQWSLELQIASVLMEIFPSRIFLCRYQTAGWRQVIASPAQIMLNCVEFRIQLIPGMSQHIDTATDTWYRYLYW